MTYSPAGPKFPIGVVEPLTRLMYRAMLHPALPLSLQRAAADRALDIEPLPRDTVVRTLTLGGRPTERVTVGCLLYTSPSPRDKRQSRMPSSA